MFQNAHLLTLLGMGHINKFFDKVTLFNNHIVDIGTVDFEQINNVSASQLTDL